MLHKVSSSLVSHFKQSQSHHQNSVKQSHSALKANQSLTASK